MINRDGIENDKGLENVRGRKKNNHDDKGLEKVRGFNKG